MIQEKLSGLVILSIEKVMLEKLELVILHHKKQGEQNLHKETKKQRNHHFDSGQQFQSWLSGEEDKYKVN